MASCVLLSALAIPPYDKASGAMTDAQTELEHERSVRMAAILGFSVVRAWFPDVQVVTYVNFFQLVSFSKPCHAWLRELGDTQHPCLPQGTSNVARQHSSV
jgi:hypothetical protein